jgi:hypothetical protein
MKAMSEVAVVRQRPRTVALWVRQNTSPEARPLQRPRPPPGLHAVTVDAGTALSEAIAQHPEAAYFTIAGQEDSLDHVEENARALATCDASMVWSDLVIERVGPERRPVVEPWPEVRPNIFAQYKWLLARCSNTSRPSFVRGVAR